MLRIVGVGTFEPDETSFWSKWSAQKLEEISISSLYERGQERTASVAMFFRHGGEAATRTVDVD